MIAKLILITKIGYGSGNMNRYIVAGIVTSEVSRLNNNTYAVMSRNEIAYITGIGCFNIARSVKYGAVFVLPFYNIIIGIRTCFKSLIVCIQSVYFYG